MDRPPVRSVRRIPSEDVDSWIAPGPRGTWNSIGGGRFMDRPRFGDYS